MVQPVTTIPPSGAAAIPRPAPNISAHPVFAYLSHFNELALGDFVQITEQVVENQARHLPECRLENEISDFRTGVATFRPVQYLLISLIILVFSQF
jgi:hypothetical protein